MQIITKNYYSLKDCIKCKFSILLKKFGKIIFDVALLAQHKKKHDVSGYAE